MTYAPLAPYQVEIIERPIASKIFLEGQAGSGKTTVAIWRLLALLKAGVPASSILLLVPQRTLAVPYQNALLSPDLDAGGQVTVLTVGGLAKRMVGLFWPLIAEEVGFSRPDRPPAFLTLETSLYYMAYLVRPKLNEGLFDSVTIDRNRIYSQVLDNLNKAAIVGFPYTEIGSRLKSVCLDNTEQANVYEDAQSCATLFREYCLQNNLLDFSLQTEIFSRHLWPAALCREYLKRTYCHVLADNLEEDTPVAHDLLRSWLPDLDSALLVYDTEAGYRRFLGADPYTAQTLVEACTEHHIFRDTLIASPALRTFGAQLGQALDRPQQSDPLALPSHDLQATIHLPDVPLRFYPQMLNWVVDQVAGLLQEGVDPSDIVILAPLLPDSLCFALVNRLEARGIPYRSHRPSRSLREEPAAQALLSLAALAHPAWGLRPSKFEVAYGLIQAIERLDLVRAQLLVEAAYTTRGGLPYLASFEKIKPDTRERITYTLGNRYETLRLWLEDYSAAPEAELDFFFSRLFGEVLSQPGFGFHNDYNARRVAEDLIESAQKFRWSVENRTPAPENPESEEDPLGKEYVDMIEEGILAAQYVQSWEIPPDNAVLLAPAYTFLLANQPVEHQFWLDIGSSAWFERLYQPLTHPIVLTREWPRDRLWTDVEEYEYNRDTLYRLVLGLVRRCKKQIHLGICEVNEGGYETRGMLLRAIQHILQQSREQTA